MHGNWNACVIRTVQSEECLYTGACSNTNIIHVQFMHNTHITYITIHSKHLEDEQHCSESGPPMLRGEINIQDAVPLLHSTQWVLDTQSLSATVYTVRQPYPHEEYHQPFSFPLILDTKSPAGFEPGNKGWAAWNQLAHDSTFSIIFVYDLFYFTLHIFRRKTKWPQSWE